MRCCRGHGTLDEQPLRLSWAVPGGPDADLAWAEDVLRRRRIERRGPAVQVRSWNLSSIWRLPLADAGPAWLKVVPPFFGHEGDVLRRLQARPGAAAARPRRAADPHGRSRGRGPVRRAAARARADGRPARRAPGGLDRPRGGAAGDAAAGLARPGADGGHRGGRGAASRGAGRGGGGDAGRVRRGAGGAVRGGARRAGCRTRSCTATTTRATSAARRSGSRCSTGATPASASRCWTCPRSSPRSRPPPSPRSATAGSPRGGRGCPRRDPDRAAALLAPVAAARQATIYQRFVDGIEPVERRHHDADAREWLERCAALVEDERPSSVR